MLGDSVFELLFFDFGDLLPRFIEEFPNFGPVEEMGWVMALVETGLGRDFLPDLIFICLFGLANSLNISLKLFAWSCIALLGPLYFFQCSEPLFVLNPVLLYIMFL